MADKPVPTLIDWMGGTSVVEELIERFYEAVVEDALLQPLFAEMDGQHFRYVAMFISEVFRGPEAYSAERGGHRNMIRKHIGKGFTEEQRQRWVSLLLQTADEVGVRDDLEFRSSLTDLKTLHYSRRARLSDSADETAFERCLRRLRSWS